MKNKTVLLVDDSTTNNLLFSDILYESKIKTLVAIDGKQAIKIIDKHELDLIVLDIMMPRVNGLEVLEHMGNAGHKVPVLVMTANTDSKVKRQAKDLGAADYINKPVDLDKFLQKVKLLLR